jgi:hypothetical protein
VDRLDASERERTGPDSNARYARRRTSALLLVVVVVVVVVVETETKTRTLSPLARLTSP